MPIVVRYDSPALVAGSAVGVGAYRQAGEDQQRADYAADQDRRALQLAMQIQDQNSQARDADRRNQLAQDQLALGQYGDQLQAFGQAQQLAEGGRRFDAGQRMDAAQLAQQQQALEQRLAVTTAGQQLTAGTRMATTDATNATRQAIASAGQQQQLTLQEQRDQAAMERTMVGANTSIDRAQIGDEAALGRVAYTQDRIDARNGPGGVSPTQARLQANDTYGRQQTALRADVTMIGQSLRTYDEAIKRIASPYDPTKALDPKNQATLDQLYATRGQVNADGSASGLAGQLAQAQRAYRDHAAAAAAASTTTTSGTKTAANAAPKRITGDADYDSLPSGATFIAPDGSTRRKP